MNAPAITASTISHRYGRASVLNDINLAVAPGEFLTFLGPSGCGKTTLLRILAGFLNPTAGSVHLHGCDVTHVPPHKRPLNMVFQRPSLFPHLTVGRNVAFSLELGRAPRDEIRQRVADALKLVRLSGYEPRRSHELSGGQMQRVALARALVGRPKVLLLDEPLSALDLAIRLEMEAELRRVHRETGSTFVYVTHDQREALAISDRIAVFKGGHIEQIGVPAEIYGKPATEFVARFVGDANVIPTHVMEIIGERAAIDINGVRFDTRASGCTSPGAAKLVLRQEAVRLVDAASKSARGLAGTIRDFAYRGAGHGYHIEVPGLGELLKAEIPAIGPPLDVGSKVCISFEGPVCVIQGG